MTKEELFEAMKSDKIIYCIDGASLRLNQCKVDMVGVKTSRILRRGNRVEYHKNKKLYSRK